MKGRMRKEIWALCSGSSSRLFSSDLRCRSSSGSSSLIFPRSFSPVCLSLPGEYGVVVETEGLLPESLQLEYNRQLLPVASLVWLTSLAMVSCESSEGEEEEEITGTFC